MTQIVSQQASANIDLIASELEESTINLVSEAVITACKENKRLIITEHGITESVESKDKGTMNLGVSSAIFYVLRYCINYSMFGLKFENEKFVLTQ